MNSEPTPPPDSPPSPAPAKTKSPVGRVILIVAGVTIAAWLAHVVLHLWRYEETDDAFVSGHVHQVSAQVSGPVKAVLVSDNQTVKAGDPLVEIDPLEFEIAALKAQAGAAQEQAEEAQAQATEAQVAAALPEARARVAEAEAEVQQAQAQSTLADQMLQRDREMNQGPDHAVTPADLDSATSMAANAHAKVRAAAANLSALEAAVTSAQAQDQVAGAQRQAAHAAVSAAQAEIRDAQRKLSYAKITAPADGRVGNKNVEVGDRVQTGQTLLVLVEPEVWIIANFKETQLARLHAGSVAEVRMDAIPGRTFRGTIQSLAPASGAQFALLPADNATGNFTKVVQRVPVKIVLDPGSFDGIEDRIRPGLSAVVNVKIR
jgi:membrane fusion protein (multidrug efflux system)